MDECLHAATNSATTDRSEAIASTGAVDTKKTKKKRLYNYKHFALSFCHAHNRCAAGGTGTACEKIACKKLHVCRRWLAGCCKQDECKLGHSLKTDHNVGALRRRGFTIDEQTCYDQVRKVLSRAFPKVCYLYNHEGGCQK